MEPSSIYGLVVLTLLEAAIEIHDAVFYGSRKQRCNAWKDWAQQDHCDRC